ncbi:helix-turn-helix domain-containing protein [Micromonospora arborensis]
MEIIPALLPHLTGLRLEAVVVRGVGVRIDAATQTVRARCGTCGIWSATVHGRYVRRLADVRLGGHEVLVALTVRRFTCVNTGCRRRTTTYHLGQPTSPTSPRAQCGRAAYRPAPCPAVANVRPRRNHLHRRRVEDRRSHDRTVGYTFTSKTASGRRSVIPFDRPRRDGPGATVADPHELSEAWRALGQQLAMYRKASGHTQHSLAPIVFTGRSTIANTEVGRQHPERAFWMRCDEVLDTDGTLTARYDQIIAVRRKHRRARGATAFTTALTATGTALMTGAGGKLVEDTDIVTAVANGRGQQVQVSRRALLQAVPGGAVASLAGAEPLFAATRAAQVDPAVVEHFAVLRSVLVESDNRVGAAAILPTARQQLGHIADYRRAARGSLRDSLLSTEARWAEFAGWLSDDLGDRDSGEWWLAQALTMAQEAGDIEFTAYVFARMAQRALDAADQDRVLGLARAAERTGSTQEQVRAFAAVQRAHGHTVEGDADSFRSAIDEAHHLAAVTGTDSGGLGAFCTRPYISAQEGEGWLRLGRPSAAVRCFGKALDAWPETYRRERGRYLARTAAAHAADDEPELAAAAALAALNLANLTRSARIQREVAAAGRQLTAFSTEPGVQQLHAALAASTASA